MRKLILFFQIILLALPVALHAQGKVVTGTVRDISGVLPGATVAEKSTPSNVAITNADGKFSLTVKGTGSVVSIKFVGYATQDVNTAGKTRIDVILQPNDHGLDEVAVVGFTPRKRITSTGAVSSINAAEIRTVPTANVQNALAGRLPGFTSVQASGQPGKDASDFFIRGQSSLNAGNQPLILVDDIEYTYDQLQQINVNEIETISILKDASSTAIYGIKGANGVLIVTTRRGKSGSPKFNFRVEGGLQTPTITPKFLNSFQAATLIDEAETNDAEGTGLAPNLTFSAHDLQLFQDGSDPYGHPNTDWYNDVFRKYTYQANTNLDISGGNDQVKYFISGGAFNQNGNTKNFNDPQDLVNTNYYFTRYNFRSNLDLKANKTLTLRLDVTTRFADINAPGLSNPIGTIYDFRTETPFSAPFINPNGSYAFNNAPAPFTQKHVPTLNAELANGGYSHDRRTDFNVLVGAIQNLDALTKGLSVTARVAYASTEDYNKGSNFIRDPVTSFPSYYYNPLTNTYTKNAGAPFVNQQYTYFGGTSVFTTNLDIQVFSNYDRTFGDHHITGLLLFNQTSLDDQANVPQNFRGLSLKAGYDYKQKYLFDLNAAYNGSDRFASNHRYSLFPALGVGWVVSKEDWFKKIAPVFSLFKFRGSYGIVGSDAAPNNRYPYIQNYTTDGGTGNNGFYTFGQSPVKINGVYEGALANPNIVWEKDRKLDIGLDANLLNDHLSITADVFHDIRYDEFVLRGGVPDVIGVALPYENLGKVQNQGYDGQVTYHNSVGKVQYNVGFVFSYAKNKILFESEAQPAFPNLAKTGHPINQPFGYHYLGYYTAADIAAVTDFMKAHGTNGSYTTVDPTTHQTIYHPADPIAVPAYANGNAALIHAGDLKYADIAGARDPKTGKIVGDGVIDAYDQTAVGNPSLPNTTLGLTLGAAYKGFSISVLFQGSFNYSYIITGNGIEPFQSQFQPVHLGAWTPETAATATFPRLSTNFAGTINSPSAYPSDYWYLNAYYVRLKTVDIGYQLPANLLPFHVDNARIYFSAYNLVTWNNFSKYQQDPEVSSNTAGDQYINARVVNLGIQLGF